MKALNLAVSGKVTEYIVPSFKMIESFLKEWNIGVQDQRELFISIANVLKENKRYHSNGLSDSMKVILLIDIWSFIRNINKLGLM